jgi:hypothetical protein
MYFTWLDVEIDEFYRRECIAQAHNYRLIRSSSHERTKQSGFVHRGLKRLGELLEALGRNLQGMQFNDGNDLLKMSSKGAGYE